MQQKRKQLKSPRNRSPVDDKVDNVEPPESPDYGYDYKPMPYEKAIAMNGNNVNNNDTTLYTQLQNEIDEFKEGENKDQNEEPLYEKMRKSSKETDVWGVLVPMFSAAVYFSEIVMRCSLLSCE